MKSKKRLILVLSLAVALTLGSIAVYAKNNTDCKAPCTTDCKTECTTCS